MSECRVEDVKEYVHLEIVSDLMEIVVELNAMSVYTIITGTHYYISFSPTQANDCSVGCDQHSINQFTGKMTLY